MIVKMEYEKLIENQRSLIDHHENVLKIYAVNADADFRLLREFQSIFEQTFTIQLFILTNALY